MRSSNTNRKICLRLKATGRCCRNFLTCNNRDENSNIIAFIIVCFFFIIPTVGFVTYQFGYHSIVVGFYGYNETTGCYPDELNLLQRIMESKN